MTSTRRPVPRESMRNDRGAATVEFVGAAVIVAGLIAAVLVAATPVGQTIAQKLCEVLGSWGLNVSCQSVAGASGDDEAPDRQCVVGESGTTVAASLDVLFVDLGGGVGMTTRELSDGTWSVTVSGVGDLGVSVSTPHAYATGEMDGVGGGLGGGAEAEAGLTAGGTGTYFFDSPEEVAVFEENMTRTFAVGALGGPITGTVTNWIWDRVTGWEPPEPTIISLDGGGYMAGNGTVAAGMGGVSADARLGTVLGGEYNLETDETTVYLEMSAEAAASAFTVVPGASGSAGSSTVLSITQHPRSGEYTYRFITESAVTGSAGTADAGTAWRLTAEVTTDGSILDSSDPEDALETLLSTATVTQETYSYDETVHLQGAAGAGAVVFDLAGSVSAASTAREIESASYYSPTRGWVLWAECA